MSESEHLSEALTGLLLEEENGWFLPVFGALEGLSAEQAARSPAEKFNSPWSVVRHMTYWMEVIQLRLRGDDPKSILGEDWLPLQRPASEDDWAADKQRLKEVTLQLADTVRVWDDTLLETSFRTSGHNHRQVIQGVIGHNCYHTNEIISSRHMLGYWLEQT